MDAVTVPGFLSPTGLLALIWTATGVSFLFVVARTFIRIRFAGGLGVEDGWVYLAMATLLTNSILQTVQLPSVYFITAVFTGIIPQSEESLVQGDNYVRYEFAIIGLFWTVLWCVKASFLAVYYKLFAHLPAYRRLWYALAGFTLLVYAGCWTLSANTCQPSSDYFIFGECISPEEVQLSRANVYYSTVVDITTDLMSTPLSHNPSPTN